MKAFAGEIATLLLITSLGLTMAFKMRFWNIGGEGQILVGAICSSAIAVYYGNTWPSWLLIGTMFLARFGNITVVAGQGVELQSVAASVVGGVNINGGLGTPFGAFLAFGVGLGGVGVWLGMATGLTIVAGLLTRRWMKLSRLSNG